MALDGHHTSLSCSAVQSNILSSFLTVAFLVGTVHLLTPTQTIHESELFFDIDLTSNFSVLLTSGADLAKSESRWTPTKPSIEFTLGENSQRSDCLTSPVKHTKHINTKIKRVKRKSNVSPEYLNNRGQNRGEEVYSEENPLDEDEEDELDNEPDEDDEDEMEGSGGAKEPDKQTRITTSELSQTNYKHHEHSETSNLSSTKTSPDEENRLPFLTTLEEDSGSNESCSSLHHYRCRSDGYCVPLSARCDGWQHCSDNSDEEHCPKRECQDKTEFTCQDGTCLSAKLRCDGEYNCPDGSDELNCHCQANQFRCTNFFQCIDKRLRCDHKYDCRDGSDEYRCEENACSLGEFRCRTGQCIHEKHRCNAVKECVDGSDEDDCVKDCLVDEFQCEDGMRCISRNLVCNQEYDCIDGSDERKCIENNCPDNMFRCRDGQCIAKKMRCDFNKDCYDGSDEFDCQIICGVNEFECQIDGRCIHESLRCDGFYDCFDFSDEQHCENRTCRLSQFRCGTGLCVDRTLLCNGESDCPDRADELECWVCRMGQFNCANGQCVEKSQRCDGFKDCGDNSDEADCPRQEIALQVYPERQTIRQGQEAIFRCRDEGDLRMAVRWLREDGRPLPAGAIDQRGRLTLINVQNDHSGVYVCVSHDDTPDSVIAKKAAYLTVQPTFDYEIMINHSPLNDNEASLPTEPDLKFSNCASHQFSCASGECVPKEHACDGDFDCTDQSDEHNCQCEPNQFKCDNGFCILKVYRCDSDDDCGDLSDERFCESEIADGDSTCKGDEYQCESGNQCIPKSFQCDGQFDCQDKSDEIGCSRPTIVHTPNEIVIVNEGDSVSFTCRAIGIPTPLINWRKNEQQIAPPPKATTTSQNGLGTLTIHDTTIGDQGTYSCEAINSRDTLFAHHQTILVVKPMNQVCQTPMFNNLATDASECLRCFCFGVTDSCFSSSVQMRTIRLEDYGLTIVPVERNLNGTYQNVMQFYPPDQSAIRFDKSTLKHSITTEVVAPHTPDNVHFYWRLPHSFYGNQLMSYGGYLRYSISYRESFLPRPINIPDVIIQGAGITLYHYEKNFTRDTSGDIHVKVHFWPGEWHRNDTYANSEVPLLFEDTTREDIMIVLHDLKDILIKASYDASFMDSAIHNIELESAKLSNVSNPTRSAYIEQCSCPEGYVGSSCERCALGYMREPSGRHLGKCLPMSVACHCNGHSDECDRFTGQCLNCRDHTEGFYCERCQRGYYHDPDVDSGQQPKCIRCPCGQNSIEQLKDFEVEWNTDFPEKWLLIPCRFDSSSRDVMCDLCPIGYQGKLCNQCARGFAQKINIQTNELICERKENCLEDEFRCANGTCIDQSLRCNHVSDCLPDGNDEFGCACSRASFKCMNGHCIDYSLYCDGLANCLDNSDEIYCNESELMCNQLGSVSHTPNPITGQCQCKLLVSGSLCDQCKTGSFSLNPLSSKGCIECYCFGVTDICTPAFNLYRDFVEIKLDQYSHGIVVRDLLNTTNANELLHYDHINRELILNNFNRSVHFYWQMPYQFLGNKITSYGGFLNYTFQFQGNYFRRDVAVADAILSGKNTTLLYYYKGILEPLMVNTISIGLVENEWHLENGQPATRKDLMLVLSDVRAIFLVATLTEDISSISLKSITLDSTVEHNGAFDETMLHVDTVEECRCPLGYVGTSCERCAPGFKISSNYVEHHGQDLLCEPCFCNGHSNDCDPETGFCINCQDDTTGPYCDQCLSGFEGSPAQGTQCILTDYKNSPITPTDCQCNQNGTVNGECYADVQCNCKANVEGNRCEACRHGYFHLDATNPNGCLECDCFGVSDRCDSGLFYQSTIRYDFSDYQHRFELTNRFRTHFYSDRIISHNGRLHFYSLFWLHEKEYINGEEKLETLYWSLPRQFLGNQLTSYGGQLRYRQRYVTQADGEFITDTDVLLFGNGIMLQYINPEEFPDNFEKSFVVNINAEYGVWQKIDHRSQMTGLASRSDFIRVLKNLEMVAIRATFHTQMKESYLEEVTLDSATETNNGAPQVYSIEKCLCPEGYEGLSCERCASGYIYQNDSEGQLVCEPCQCNSHSSLCDSVTGECLDCQHNTTGEKCHLCAVGFFGDATRGSSEDCQPCACPLAQPGNNFSPTCRLDSDDFLTCTQCHGNYTGRTCEKCNSGYKGNPTLPGGRCEVIASQTPPQSFTRNFRVRIEGPKIKHVFAGSSINLKCSGSTRNNQHPFNLVWTKSEGQLPPGSSEASGVLTLQNIQQDHAGVYICTAYDLHNAAQAHTTLVVKPSVQMLVPKVHIEPPYQEVYLGDAVTFKCIAEGQPFPNIHWYMGQNKILNPSSSFTADTGMFLIPSAQKSDEAEYYCQATNSAGSDTARTVLFVRDHRYEYVHVSGQSPTARVFPPNYLAVRGESVRLDCNVTGHPVPSVRWTFAGGGPEGNLPLNARVLGSVLTLININIDQAGVYTCSASNLHGTATAQVRVDVNLSHKVRPIATVEPAKQTIVQGQTGELRCTTTGFPKPRITWQKMGDQIDPVRHKIIDEKLIIERMGVNDRGVYACRAENSEGVSQASAVVEIELREMPTIEIHRESSQIVPRGSSTYFQCRVTGGIPEPSVEWRRSEGSPMTAQVDGGMLRFKHVTPQDEGVYICTAENIAGRVTAQAILRLSGAPRIKIKQNTPYRVRQGEHVRLECQVMSLEYPSQMTVKLSWHKLKFTSTTKNNTLYEVPRYPVYIFDNRAILEFNSIKAEDSGIYGCSARSSMGDSEEKIQVIVEEESTRIVPDVFVEEKVVTVAAGSRAELRCFVRGTNRQIEIKWTRAENKSLPEMSSVENGTLTIDHVKPEDSGDYYCMGYVDPTSPRVLFKNRAPPSIQIYPASQTVRPGDTAYIDCLAYDNSHSVTVDWSRIGSEMPAGVSTEEGNARLILRGVEAIDAGQYLCTAVNAAGKAEAVGEIIVDKPRDFLDYSVEEVALIRSNLDLKCPSKLIHNKTFSITWRFENFEELPRNVHVMHDELRIRHLSQENTGLYTCLVTNEDLIVDEGSILVKVKEPTYRSCRTDQYSCYNGQCIDLSKRCDKVVDCEDKSDEEFCFAIFTDIKIVPSQELLHLGDTLELTCLVSSDSQASLSWSLPYHHSDSMPDNILVRNNLLRVESIRPDNGGVYRCKVDTQAGKFIADYLLVIQDIITPSLEIVETRVVASGEELSVHCPTELQSPVTFTWHKYLTVARSKEDTLPANAVIYSNGTLLVRQVSPRDAGTYVCNARNEVNTVSVPLRVVVEGTVPRFTQHPRATYLALPTLPDAYSSFEVAISVRPEAPDGLILYNGANGSTSVDYISLGLRESYVEFRFELGSGTPAVLRSEFPISLNQWHLIRISRQKHIGKLRVDSQDIVTNSASQQYVGLDLGGPLYVGGVPKFELLPSSVEFNQSFVGCIAHFKVNFKLVDLLKDATFQQDVSRCETCPTDACSKDAICQENVMREFGHECICPTGLSGPHCELNEHTCHTGVCHQSHCVEHKPSGFTCQCLFGKSGRFCEQDISIGEPYLTNGAYMAFRTPRNTLNKLQLKLKIKPKFLSATDNYLLLYSGQHKNGSGDFLALVVTNRTIQLSFDTGSGNVNIVHTLLHDEEWVEICVERDRREANLSVGGGEPVWGRAPGRTHGLSLLTPLYLGGYNRSSLSLPSSLGSLLHFEGCIGYLEINGKEVDLLRRHVESVNVADCGSGSPCKLAPCFNGGVCYELNRTAYQCQCDEPYTGERCEQLKGPCERQSMPCLNRAECENRGDSFVCHCALGYGGQVCANQVKFDNTTAAKLDGDGFISFDGSYLTQSNQGFLEVKFKIKTNTEDGLLFFYGQRTDMPTNGKDFLAASINAGQIVLTFELGSGLGHVQSSVLVNDDQPHSVILRLANREGAIEVDGQIEQGYSPGTLNILNVNGDIFFGGIPNYSLMTGGRYLTGFSGCIVNIEIGISGIIDILHSSKRSRNVFPCDHTN